MESHLKSLILKNQRMQRPEERRSKVRKKNYILEKDLKLRLLMKKINLKNKGSININPNGIKILKFSSECK